MAITNGTDDESTVFADPESAEFGTNVGQKIAAQADFSDDSDALGTALEPESHTCNVGRTEQKARLAVGLASLAVAAFAPLGRGWRLGLGALGLMGIVTGARRYCPMSAAFGINTCRDDEQ